MVVRFTPIGAHLFLGLPMHLIANDAIDLEQIDPALARTLKRALTRARSWTERFAAMEELIAQRIANAEMSGAVRVCGERSCPPTAAWHSARSPTNWIAAIVR